MMVRPAFLLIGILAALACDSTEPVIPKQIETVSGGALTGTVNTALPVIVRVLDAKGKPVANAGVTWTAAAGAITGEATTNKEGRASATWTLPTKTGVATATARVADLVASFNATAQAGPATKVTTTGDFQSATAVGTLPVRLSVQMADTFGNAVAAVPVTWRVVRGGGRLVEQEDVTDATGRASAAWIAGATVDTQVVNVSAASVLQQFRAVVRPSRLALAPRTTNLMLGTTLRPGINLTDINGVRLGTSSGQLSSDNVAVAEVVNGAIVPRGAGSATISVRSDTMTAIMNVTVGTFPTTARGAAITLDSTTASFLTQLRTGGAIFDFPAITSAFAFAGPAPTETSQVVIDLAGGARTHFPAVVNVAAAAYNTAVLNTLMIPRRWPIRGGTHEGQTVDLSMIAAFEPPCADPSNGNCTGFFPAYWSVDPKVWPAQSLPIPVAIHRTPSTSPLSAADSAALWRVLDNMNADYGTPIFKPARIDQFTVNADNTADGAILFFIDQSLIQQNYGGYTNWWWNGRGELYKSRVRLARLDLLNNSALVSHEFLHALGHSHTCKWPTVMGGYGCSSVQRLSPQDVAYAHVAQRVKAMRVAHNASFGLQEAVYGESMMLSTTSPFALKPQLDYLFSRARTLAARGTDGAN